MRDSSDRGSAASGRPTAPDTAAPPESEAAPEEDARL